MTAVAQPPAYSGSPSTDDLVRRTGIRPHDILRFDSNVPAAAPPYARPATIAAALANVNEYRHGGNADLRRAIASAHEVSPDNVVLGAGSGDLILLAARALLSPNDSANIVPRRTFPLYRIAIAQAGATLSDDAPALTFLCRPNNPTGELTPLGDARPLIVDAAYAEYAPSGTAPAPAEGVVVLRTFSKAYGLAAARVGYALAPLDIAATLNRWQAPHPISSLSADLALAALSNPPDVRPQIEERERLAAELRALGLTPLDSHTNFVFVPTPDADVIADGLLQQGMVVRRYEDGIRVNVRDRHDDDLLLRALAAVLERPASVPPPAGRTVRHSRVTAESAVSLRLSLDGSGSVHVATGAGLYDHLLEQLAFHAGFDLFIEARGDIETGPHHTAEDVARTFGEALRSALGGRSGINRYGDATVPMDESVARVTLDLSGRPTTRIAIEPDPGLAWHVLESLAQSAGMTLHVEARGRDEHHTAEAAFKAVGRALRVAVRRAQAGVPSTKGVL